MTRLRRLAVGSALDPLDELARRSRRLAQVVEASSRRRDCREFRARLLLLVLEFACPLDSRPARVWYVPGGAARLGPEGLRRAWRGYFGEEPRSLRSFRQHLGDLENSLAIVRSPGDWMPRRPDPDHPERRPRYPETIHLLEDDLSALFWEGEGERLRRENPAAKYNPDAWKLIFRSWRKIASNGDLDLFQLADRAPKTTRAPSGGPELLGTVLDDLVGQPRPKEEPAPVPGRAQSREAAALIVGVLARDGGPWELLRAFELVGSGLRGIHRRKALQAPDRLAGSAAIFALALLRDDGTPKRRIRSRAGWLVRAFTSASQEELEGALAQVLRKTRPCPTTE